MNNKKLKQLAEESWEGCDGCDDNDKNFYVNGFVRGYNRFRTNDMKYLGIALIYFSFFSLIAVACFITKSAIPLWGLLLTPHLKA